MSKHAFDRLFDSYQQPSKDESDYNKKQRDEPTYVKAPKRGRVTSPLGPLAKLSLEAIVHQNRGKP